MAEKDIVLRVENLSKVYRLGEIGTYLHLSTSQSFVDQSISAGEARVSGKEDPFAKVGTTNDRTQTAQENECILEIRLDNVNQIAARKIWPLNILRSEKLSRQKIKFKILFERSEFILSAREQLNFSAKDLQVDG